MRKIISKVLTVAIAIAFFTSCGLTPMVKKYETVRYEVTPKVLETHGGKINVAIKGQIPAKYFHKKAVVDFTPVLKYEGGSVALKPLTLQGEKATGNGTVISKANGGSFSYADVITYTPAMNVSELMVDPKASLGTKSVNLGERKLADGVIYTSERIVGAGSSILAEHSYEKETIISKQANIFYPYDVYALRWNLALNKDPEAMKKIEDLTAFIEMGWAIKNIEVSAWASPEGEESYNEGLSENRGKTANNYLMGLFKKLARKKMSMVAVKNPMEEVPYQMTPRGEDWEGFMKALAASNIEDKNIIANVVNSESDLAAREKKIRDMAVIYKEIEDRILPPLRRAEMTIHCYEPKRTDEQIAELSTTYPDSLDVKELLYAATLTEDLKTQMKIYESAMKIYPENWKCYNNAGCASLEMGNYKQAADYFEKANAISPDNGIVLNNIGAAFIGLKEFDKAKTSFESAKQKGININYNMGILYIKDGDYAAALKSFGDKKCDYHVALAELLSGNNAASAKTLECADKTAEAYYLMAIVGARTSNSTMVYENLKKACAADMAYKKQAKDDREFMKYFDNSEFKNAIK